MSTSEPSSADVASAFVRAARHRMAQSLEIIEHGVAQLSVDDLHWRPFDSHNSVANIVLHLCGNLRQWVVCGVGEQPDDRDRPREFTDRTRYDAEDLLARLRETIRDADQVLASLDAADLLAPRHIQGFEVSVMDALFDTLPHLSGHAQEIVYIARFRLGEGYRFRWVPKTAAEGAT